MTSSVFSPAPLRLPFDVILRMPGSKSHANRAIIAACLTEGKTIIENATPCDDTALLVKNLNIMGFDIQYTDRKRGLITIRGGIPKKRHKKTLTLYCGNAGTTLRFLTTLACVVPGSFHITGNKHMQKRPIGDLVRALRVLGADIRDTDGCPPVHIGDGIVEGGMTHIDVSKSSQFLSAFLLIKSALPKGLRIKTSGKAVSRPYIALTEKVLMDFRKKPRKYVIEGDHSAAGAFLVLAELTHSRIRFANLNKKSSQADAKLSEVIAKMRKKSPLCIDCTDMPDQVMNLTILAAFRDGKTRITGAANLRYKECNRLAVLTKELRKAGMDIQELRDGMMVKGRVKLKSAILDPHNDHRMAMCFAVLGSVHPGIRIKNPDCVSKSYPCFFKDLEALHRSSRPIAIVGMRGVGKSTLGRKLAASLRLKHVDSDRLFEKQCGDIRRFVEKKSWKAFRREEERIVAASLKPQHVVSLGGGAVESRRTRDLLKRESFVIYLKAHAASIIERLREDRRPPLTNLPLEAEIPLILGKRAPLYESVAHVTAHEPFSAQSVIRSLRSLCSS